MTIESVQSIIIFNVISAGKSQSKKAQVTLRSKTSYVPRILLPLNIQEMARRKRQREEFKEVERRIAANLKVKTCPVK